MRATGINHFKIILIEQVVCVNFEELRAREHHHIILLKPTLNTNAAVEDIEARKLQSNTTSKIWREANAERVKAKSKEYYANNREKKLAHAKQWTETHREQSNEIKLTWALKKVNCLDCGVELSQGSMSIHRKRKHTS
jgi:hypothetical protein